MAVEHKQERKTDTQCNTSVAEWGPGKKSLVPPISVLTVSGPVFQHGTAISLLVLGLI